MVDLERNIFDDSRFQFFEIRPEGRGKSYTRKREKYATLTGNTRARIFLKFSRRRNTDLFHFCMDILGSIKLCHSRSLTDSCCTECTRFVMRA